MKLSRKQQNAVDRLASKPVPTFSNGDRVRVMQTDDMVGRWTANRRGIVFCTWHDRSDGRAVQICRVHLDGESEARDFPASVLTKVQQ